MGQICVLSDPCAPIPCTARRLQTESRGPCAALRGPCETWRVQDSSSAPRETLPPRSANSLRGPSGRAQGRAQPASLESHTIQPIAHDARHGRAADLFTVWFGSNIMLLTIVTGALGATVFHLPFTWAAGALIAGNLIGAVFMALHAAQGPILGVPQMVQTRGQFGSLGALLVVGLVIVMYVGFFASNLVLGGQALEAVTPLSVMGGIILIGLVSAVAAIFGYDLIHAYARAMSYAAGIVLLLTALWVPLVHGLPHDFWDRGVASAAGLLGTVSVAALWQIAYAPYVSDYTRYMPAETGVRSAFWATYWGCTLGSTLPMLLGAAVGACVKGDDVIGGLGELTGRLAPAVFITFALAMVATNAMNLYCGALSVMTFGQAFVPRWSPRARARALVAAVLLAASIALAVLGKDSFLVNYTNFILLLLYVLVPWTAINLVDYYLVQHGKYDVGSFFRADGGLYGRINIVAVACYALGIIVQIPFMSTPLHTGSVARHLHEADVSWIVGLAVTGPLYYVLALVLRRSR
ncbi:MAG TPA: cytosine permease [Steroidobacteraceae bacterium]|nr:cytosine permease [Steroidobacteraceae bacterium]